LVGDALFELLVELYNLFCSLAQFVECKSSGKPRSVNKRSDFWSPSRSASLLNGAGRKRLITVLLND
jgi:hypothetical protein